MSNMPQNCGGGEDGRGVEEPQLRRSDAVVVSYGGRVWGIVKLLQSSISMRAVPK